MSRSITTSTWWLHQCLQAKTKARCRRPETGDLSWSTFPWLDTITTQEYNQRGSEHLQLQARAARCTENQSKTHHLSHSLMHTTSATCHRKTTTQSDGIQHFVYPKHLELPVPLSRWTTQPPRVVPDSCSEPMFPSFKVVHVDL